MRIGLLAPPWVPVPPPAYGGTESIIDRLARGFLARGHEVLLWSTGDAEGRVPTEFVFPEAVFDELGRATTEIHHAVTGYERFSAWGADVVHDHTTTGPLCSLAFPNLPTVTTCHGPFDAAARALYRTVGPQVAIIAISAHQARQALLGGLRTHRVIHHGVDLADYPIGTGRGDADGPYYLFLGRMNEDKGVHRAIEAVRSIGGRLLIAAKLRERAEKEYFTARVEPLLGDDAVYVGEVGGPTKAALLGGALALVNPIRWPEPFGLVMIEALASGTPVVSYAEGAAPEIIEHGITGYLCRDEADFARRLRDAANLDRERCRHAAETSFSTIRMVDEHLSLFRELIDVGRRTSRLSRLVSAGAA